MPWFGSDQLSLICHETATNIWRSVNEKGCGF
jgi:hypothetical protein